MMPKTRFTEFPTLSVDPRVGISRSASETDDSLFFYLFSEKSNFKKTIYNKGIKHGFPSINVCQALENKV